MANLVTITGRKNSITKSKSGHYTASVSIVGTWGPTGVEYPYAKVVAHRNKIELFEAREVISSAVTPDVGTQYTIGE